MASGRVPKMVMTLHGASCFPIGPPRRRSCSLPPMVAARPSPPAWLSWCRSERPCPPRRRAAHRASRNSMAFSSPLVVSTTADRPRMALMTYRTATACFWEKPMSMSRWWTWPRSGVMGLCPWTIRRRMAKAGVKDGQAQHEEGHGKGDDGVELEQALDGHHRQHKAQEGGARVPHKDLGRVQVIGQKAHAAARQGGHEDGHVGLGHQPGR